jgi:uncharacterized phage protein gp47/JayE
MPDLFVQVPIETDPDAITQIGFDYLVSKIADWEPSDGQLDTWILSANGRQSAELRDIASDVPAAIFRYFGASLVNVQPIDAVPATVNVTFTALDVQGYTIPAGTAAGIRDTSGVLWAFETQADVIIPAGTTTVTPVTMVATEEGASASNLGAAAAPMEIISALAFLASVTQLGASAGGTDAEEDEDYLNRLAKELELQSPRPILPGDFATFSRNIAGVGRALAIDGYDAVAGTYNNARTITVAVTDINGVAAGSTVKANVLAALQAAREVNFLIYVIDPTPNTIDVTYDVKMFPGFTAVDVQAAINAALAEYLSPATWGNPPFGDPHTWLQQTKVKVNDLIVVIGNVPGVQDVNSVSTRPGTGSYATTDITLSGAAPLPSLGVTVPTVA